MRLRGCSQPEAVGELKFAGRETGLGTERIARALVNVLADENGDVPDPDRVAAVNRWRHLLDRAGWKPASGRSCGSGERHHDSVWRGKRLRQVLVAKNDRWRLRRLTSRPGSQVGRS